ncbi:MAG TPA: SprT family zinc-dependent metalloprotease, partial [Thiolinea sp.]|nr:SprT family zinc-dependent metalloprotease [Thiolinea sp.]
QQQLLIRGKLEGTEACQAVLQTWLKQYAKLYLPALLSQLATETGLSYQQCSIKNQQTRWGSCSSQGRINLNAKLLFLPAMWVRYVLIHELCHTRELNHSPRFWALVKQFEPNYPAIQRAMKNSMHTLPNWVN